MSDKKFNTPEELNAELRREYQAYEELRMIIAIAIETQNFASLEPNIAIWENKYHVDEFIDLEIVRKIKAILNKDYLSRLVGDYLASQVLHEQAKQQAAYDDLKNIISKAKKTKNYKAAEKDITAWKASLSDRGLSLYSFNKMYTRQIFKMLLFPSQELAIEQEASDSLKQIVNNSKNLESSELEKEITTWKSKYSLDTFPDKLEEELNGMTADIFKAITIKKSEEAAINELQSFITSEKMSSPAEEIPILLSKYDFTTFSDTAKSQIDDLTTYAMSLVELDLDNIKPKIEGPINTYIPPTQQEAIYDLKDVFAKSSNNFEAIFNWIYLYRTIDFVPEARDEIKSMFRMAGFAKPTGGEYRIPSLDTKMENLKPKDVNDIREKVILNYLGILYAGNGLSSIEQGNISTIRNKQEVLHAAIDVIEDVSIEKASTENDISAPALVLPVLDNEPTTSTATEEESTFKEAVEVSMEDKTSNTVGKDSSPVLQEVAPDVEDKNNKKDAIISSSLAENIQEDIPKDVVFEDPEEVNILIEDLLQDPMESIELSSNGKKSDKKQEQQEEEKTNSEIESDITYDAELDLSDGTSTTAGIHVKEDDKQQEIEEDPDANQDDSVNQEQDLPNSEDLHTASSLVSREPVQENQGENQAQTTSMLDSDAQESIENINYVTTSYSMQRIPFFRRKRTMHEAEKLGYSLEKNNGF